MRTRKDFMSHSQTVLFYAGACATLVLALLAFQRYFRQHTSPQTLPKALTPEDEAALFAPLSANGTAISTAEKQRIFAPEKGGAVITQQEQDKLFQPIYPTNQ